jgi:glycine oxidase
VVYACGYSRNGVLLAPLAAASVVAAICEQEQEYDPAPFSPARFSGEPPVAG